MKQEYKEFDIEYSEQTNKWIVKDGDTIVSKHDSLLNAKKAIDTAKKKKCTKVPVFFLDYNGCYHDAIATGPNSKEISPYLECWVTIGNERRIRNRSSIYQQSDKNIGLVSEINDLQGRIEAIQKEMKAKMSQLEPFVAPEDWE